MGGWIFEGFSELVAHGERGERATVGIGIVIGVTISRLRSAARVVTATIMVSLERRQFSYQLSRLDHES